MIKKFNEIMYLSILSATLFALIGFVLLINPKLSMSIISYIVAIILIIVGVLFIIRFYDQKTLIDFLSTGMITTLLGIVLLLYPKVLETFIPITIGIWIIVSSVFKIRISLILKQLNIGIWLITFLLNILMLICGIGLIINPEVGALTITTFVGIILLAYSLSDLVNSLIFKRNVNEIVKILK